MDIMTPYVCCGINVSTGWSRQAAEQVSMRIVVLTSMSAAKTRQIVPLAMTYVDCQVNELIKALVPFVLEYCQLPLQYNTEHDKCTTDRECIKLLIERFTSENGHEFYNQVFTEPLKKLSDDHA